MLQSQSHPIYTLLMSQIFSPFCSKASCVHVNVNFETSASNDLKMTFNATRPNVPLICFSQSPNFFSLKCSADSDFELTFSLRHVHWMTTNNGLEHYDVKCTPYICYTITPESHISIHFALQLSVFQLQAISPLNTKGQRYPIYILLVPLSCNFLIIPFALRPAVFKSIF